MQRHIASTSRRRCFVHLVTGLSVILLVVTLALWVRGYWVRDGIWYSTETARYSVHSHHGRIWFWSLSGGRAASDDVWATPARLHRGVVWDSAADSYYEGFGKRSRMAGERGTVHLAAGGRLFGGAPGAVDWQAMGFRYVRNNSWLPLAQLQSGYPTAPPRRFLCRTGGSRCCWRFCRQWGRGASCAGGTGFVTGCARPAGMICGPVRSGVRNAEWRRGGVMRVRRKRPMERIGTAVYFTCAWVSGVRRRLLKGPYGMRYGYFAICSLLSVVLGCASPAFRLTDESAMNRLMATRYVADLQRKNPTPLTCWVEDSEPGARLLYLGEDHADHAVRVGAFRVTRDGRVWVNADPTRLEDRWTVVQ